MKIKLTHDEFIEKMKERYGDATDYTLNRWAIQRCVECPNCEFFGDEDAAYIALWEYPHCTVISKRSIRCISKTNKTYGCPSKCPRLSKGEIIRVDLDILKARLDRCIAERNIIDSKIADIQQQLAGHESALKDLESKKGES